MKRKEKKALIMYHSHFQKLLRAEISKAARRQYNEGDYSIILINHLSMLPDMLPDTVGN